MPHLVVESTIEDLSQTMRENSVEKAVIVAHPPLISNSFIFYSARGRKDFIPCVYLYPKELRTPSDLDTYLEQGVKIFKIHTIADGLELESPYYQEMLKYLDSKGAILILHSGAIYSRLFFKKPTAGDITHYSETIKRYKNIRFALAHMNFHEPRKAIQFAKEHSDIMLITSWQSAQSIYEAATILGAHRLLFGSDWPLLGNNIKVQKSRIEELLSGGKMSSQDAEQICYENAAKLLD